ncbi:thrS [Wigglesworthia glossinidia endosymbiont of Glossina brevipalpis]|uniref:Threonine--tRNA ligase n=1 Tax=Wigglesworthia glossinidia brevipalpis TaxID=36870 RepID=SYT_WIGBR|nr:RecName: Full=Threonine--tRNA ligase; AltName: Full=Threonyl-tRNA synthetase; Short=ThrRS [Wigglesworthia glossinidia endosymbiont of Glossina brevipalpis]BAC24227.1 thrS [Wigglesworthia glossinidia endosymbiont of Glossina brevipalpis]
MPIINFNNKEILFNYPISIIEIIKKFDKNLSENCIAAKINGKLLDVSEIINYDGSLELVKPENKIGIRIIRCSCSHLLGYAIKQLWPTSKMATNNITENGFYYDIDLNHKLSKNDLKLIEKKMHQLLKINFKINKINVTWGKAYEMFKNLNEIYKIKILEDNISKNSSLYIYHQEQYVDLCTLPHVPNIKFCMFFKIQKISGAYWKGNKKNKMLQRIYVTSWDSNSKLKNFIKNIKELEHRDHRKIGKKLDLFHIYENSPGMVFWHHNGWIIFRILEKFIRKKLKKFYYQEVKTPCIIDHDLWRLSGHLDNYKNYMFHTNSENKQYCIKPMNCPAHVLIFKKKIRSYKELPFRISEFGSCHRNEPSGSLHGLMRIRNFTQDDAHIFCMHDQILSEVSSCIKMIYEVYSCFGFKKILVKLSTRPENRIGSDEIWDFAEKQLELSLKKNKILFKIDLNEGAFYGPKIEFTLLDSLNRKWQCGTIQLDLCLANKLQAYYINNKNEKTNPVIIHRAILGSMERFIGIITEEFSGKYPLWISPIQVGVINVSVDQIDYVKKITKFFLQKKIRIISDLRNEKISFKIREYTLRFIPYIIICGKKEMESNSISVRNKYGKQLKYSSLEKFYNVIYEEIKQKKT